MSNSTINLGSQRTAGWRDSSGEWDNENDITENLRTRRLASHCSYGTQIANAALQNVGMSTRSIWDSSTGTPEYAAAVSILFTKATNQDIMLGTHPRHVLSTSLLCNSLRYDKRFEQVPLDEVEPGDIIIDSSGDRMGFAGVVINDGRIVSDSSNQGVRDNCSLSEIQHIHPAITAFHYVGFWNFYRSKALANAGFDPNEPRLPAGQTGGGRWTDGEAGGGATTSARAIEAKRFAHLAEVYSERAQDENQSAGPTAMVFDGVGQPDEQDRHKLAAEEARDIAEEMERRAYILTKGTAENYRQLVVKKYGINNPNLNEIMAYYAKKFNDQATLNYLKQQHPAIPPATEQVRKDIGMMVLFPQFEKIGEQAGEAPLTGNGAEKSVFEKTTEIAEGKGGSTGMNSSAPSNPSRPNYKAIEYVPESSRMMDENAAAYQDGAPASRYGMAPRLSGVDANGKITAKFDGVDPATGETVDRKLNVVDRPNFIKEALRQSAVASQNGFTVRWEVPNDAVQAKAQRILSANGIKNIKVVVAPK